jgi:hypothetical protein
MLGKPALIALGKGARIRRAGFQITLQLRRIGRWIKIGKPNLAENI